MAPIDVAITFAGGAMYGLTSVVVGQPLDTIKTRMQAISTAKKPSLVSTGRELFQKEGLRGLYRGGLPPFIGGAMFRSAQFGVYEMAMTEIKKHTTPGRIGYIDYQVLAAGVCGGIGRGIVEAPFEFVKVRQQVNKAWDLRSIYKGSGVTILRNSGLFSSFVVYIDITKQLTDGKGIGSFATGALCANLAWLTIWPLDVVKSQVQSGHHKGGLRQLLKHTVQSGALYRGLAPGLLRSTIANGCSMVVMTETKKRLDAFKESRQ